MLSQELREDLEKLPVIMSIPEVADALSICHYTVYRMIYEEQLPAYKDEDGIWNVNREDLMKMISKNSNQ
jgi:excisionase family DNA binding protein